MPDDGDAEFRAAVGPVRPLRQTKQTPAAMPRRPWRKPQPAPPPPLPIDLPVIEPNATVRAAQSGVPGHVLRRLDGERFDAEAELDLHGLTAAQATSALQRFIADCLAAGCERVRVIHGKGGRTSADLPVLKPLAIQSLKGHPAVLALRSAGPRDGGSGALRVLLRRV
ncbi:MAG: Smr/MutS family protein [Pseudomonadota bacterium]